MRKYAPGGVDVFLDNVGGAILDAVLMRLARGARIVLSGGVSQYNESQALGPAHYLELIAARAAMIGMFTPTSPTATPGEVRARRVASRWQADLPRRHP